MGCIIISLSVQRGMINEDWNSQEIFIEEVEIGGIYLFIYLFFNILFYFIFLFFIFFVFLAFLGPLPRHMEVPGQGVKSEL